jgi:hypothetical protein
MNTDSDGKMHLTLDKDVDWSQPIFMMLIPTEQTNWDSFVVKNPAYREKEEK